MGTDNHFPILLKQTFSQLSNRQNNDGGFSSLPGNSSRADSTAWALLAMNSCGIRTDSYVQAGDYLARAQKNDGRIVVDQHSISAIWPSYVASWAWQGNGSWDKFKNKAINFVLQTSVDTSIPQNNEFKHDFSLKGWTWIEGTFSWVDPTVLALLSLRSAGYKNHQRYLEGLKMLEDRELPSGGWNYGNTVVYGTELRHTPESTGMALSILNSKHARHTKSVNVLRGYLNKETNALSLAWALISLGTESDIPLLEEVMPKNVADPLCQTEWLSLLCVAWSVLSNFSTARDLGLLRDNLS